MKTSLTHLALALALIVSVFAKDRKDTPTLTRSQLDERTIYRRAVEAVNWGISIVNYDQMVQAMLGIKADFNQIPASFNLDEVMRKMSELGGKD